MARLDGADIAFESVVGYASNSFSLARDELPDLHLRLLERLSTGVTAGVSPSSFVEGLLRTADRQGLAVGVDTLEVPDDVRAMFPNQTKVVPDLFRQLRRFKSPAEVSSLQAAVDVNEAALAAAMEVVGPGVPWNEVGGTWRSEFAARGGIPRFWLSAAGDATIGIYEQDDHVLAVGDLLRFECSGTVRGYWCDTGRSAVVAEPNEGLQRRHDALVSGHDRFLEMAASGATLGASVQGMYATIRESGFDDFADSGWAHGIGVEAYDVPIALAQPDLRFEGGEVFALETPCFLLGWGAMQLEDTYHAADGELRRLTRLPREVRILG